MTNLLKLFCRFKNINYTECKRYAGHSKWANIRHVKMAKDQEKSSAIAMCIKKMKIAIAEGKSAKPEENLALARIIEQAKKNSLPVATLKNTLTKLQNAKTNCQSAFVESRGPSGCVLLIQLLTDNITHTRNNLNYHLKKTNFSASEYASSGIFDHKGIILAEVENHDIDKVTDDAIEVGAEDAEIIKEDEKQFLQFLCNPLELYKIKSKLEDLNYKVIQAEENYIPHTCVKLSEAEMELVSKLYDRLNGVEEVVKICTNIL